LRIIILVGALLLELGLEAAFCIVLGGLAMLVVPVAVPLIILAEVGLRLAAMIRPKTTPLP